MNYQTAGSLPQPLFSTQEIQNPNPQDHTYLENYGHEQSALDGALTKLQQDYLTAFTDSTAFQQSGGNTADLPPVTITNDDFSPSNDSPQPEQTEETGGVFPVVGDIISGAVDQVTQHTGDVFMSGVTGIGLSIAVGTAAGIMAVTAPAWVMAAGTVALVTAGLGLAGLAVCAEGPDLVENAQIVFDPSSHTALEVATAHQELKEFGGNAVHIAVGLIGGGAILKPASTVAAKMFKPAGAKAASAEAAAAGEAAKSA